MGNYIMTAARKKRTKAKIVAKACLEALLQRVVSQTHISTSVAPSASVTSEHPTPCEASAQLNCRISESPIYPVCFPHLLLAQLTFSRLGYASSEQASSPSSTRP